MESEDQIQEESSATNRTNTTIGISDSRISTGPILQSPSSPPPPLEENNSNSDPSHLRYRKSVRCIAVTDIVRYIFIFAVVFTYC